MTAKETRAAIQRLLSSHLKNDGVIGPLTEIVWDQLKAAPDDSVWPPPEKPIPPIPSDKFDARTESNLSTLSPKVVPFFRSFLSEASAIAAAGGLRVVVTSGSRTYAEQDALYEQGRSKPGPKVTNARGGYSHHNFGIALDVTCFRGNEPVYEHPLYSRLGPIGEKHGLEWGGRWHDPADLPHFEYPTGLTLAQLRDRVAKGEAIV